SSVGSQAPLLVGGALRFQPVQRTARARELSRYAHLSRWLRSSPLCQTTAFRSRPRSLPPPPPTTLRFHRWRNSHSRYPQFAIPPRSSVQRPHPRSFSPPPPLSAP